jgi:DNA-binding HxlR family transcriptional regulator
MKEEIIKFDEIEEYKENFKPLKGGRSKKMLENSLTTLKESDLVSKKE